MLYYTSVKSRLMKTNRRLFGRWLGGAGVFVIAVACLLFGFSPQQTRAENERIVTIYRDGIAQTVVTNAETVGEALQRTNITLGPHDSVEPAKDTLLVAPSYSINVYRARPVTVIDGLQRYQVMSPHTSGRQIAEDAGLTMYTEDEFSLERINNFLGDGGVGLKMTISRSTPLGLVLYGKHIDAHTRARTVGELLKEKKVQLGEQDGVSPGSDTPITAGMTVAVYRNGSQVVNEEQDVPFTTKRVQDADMEIGQHSVRVAGVNGKRVVTYQIELRDGKETGRKEIQNVVTIEPKEQVEVLGAKSNGFGGAFGEALASLRGCEAGGRYDRNSGNGYYGAYQFSKSTWANFGGYVYANEAPAAVQDEAATRLYQRRGWQPWPGCTAKLGLRDIYR
jgi:resuscitation-promoting factor RpfB